MRLSLIVPVYNGEKYLKRCLASILKNNFNQNKWEVIFVNDGSSDESLNILLEYENKIKNIKIISQENKGLSAARNVGIREAKGEYLCFLDCDDSIEENFLSDILNLLEKNKVDLIIFGMQRRTNDEKIYLKKIPLKDSISDLLYNSYACNKVIRKELMINNNIYFPIKKYYEDAHTIPKLFFLSKNIIYLDKIYYNYYLNEGSITQKRDDERLFHLLEAYIDLEKEITCDKNEYKKFLKEFKNEFLLKILPNNSTIFILKNYKIIKTKLFLYESNWSIKDEIKLLSSLLYPKHYLKKLLRR